MKNEIITTLHPDQDPNTNLYPNIKKENIPDKSIDTNKLDPNYVSSMDNRFNYLDEKIDNLEGGEPKYVDTSKNILALIENKGIAVATDTGHWYYWDGTQYVDGGLYQTILLNKVDYTRLVNTPKTLGNINLVSRNRLTNGYLSNERGNIVSSDIYVTTDFIKVKAGEKISIYGNSRKFLAYDIIKNAIPSTYQIDEINNYQFTPTQDGYIRVSFWKTDTTYQIEYGDQNSDYQEYSNYKKIDEFIFNNKDMFFKNLELQNGFIANNGNIGDLVSLLINTTWPNDYKCYRGSCKEGDIFLLNIFGGGTANCFAFLNANRQIIYKSDVGTHLYGEIIVAPKNAKYIVINHVVGSDSDISNPYVKKLIYYTDTIYDLPKNEMAIFKNMVVIGDSLSCGTFNYFIDSDTQENYEDDYYSWLKNISRQLGNTSHILAQPGLSTYTWPRSTEQPKLAQYPSQCYFIALGHNDANEGRTLGNGSADIDFSNYNNNANTFYGNYAAIIQRIKEVSPNAKIFVITMIDDRGISYGYNDAIRNMADYFDNVYVVDLGNKYLDIESWEYTGGHANAEGYLNYSKMVNEYVNKIIRENRYLFSYVQLIGSNKEEYIPDDTKQSIR